MRILSRRPETAFKIQERNARQIKKVFDDFFCSSVMAIEFDSLLDTLSLFKKGLNFKNKRPTLTNKSPIPLKKVIFSPSTTTPRRLAKRTLERSRTPHRLMGSFFMALNPAIHAMKITKDFKAIQRY